MKQVWICEFCNKRVSDNKTLTHEDNCFHNPKFKVCASCENYKSEIHQIEGLQYYCDIDGLYTSEHYHKDKGECPGWKKKND